MLIGAFGLVALTAAQGAIKPEPSATVAEI